MKVRKNLKTMRGPPFNHPQLTSVIYRKKEILGNAGFDWKKGKQQQQRNQCLFCWWKIFNSDLTWQKLNNKQVIIHHSTKYISRNGMTFSSTIKKKDRNTRTIWNVTWRSTHFCTLTLKIWIIENNYQCGDYMHHSGQMLS